MVLGMQWLGTLGSMEVDWKKLTMKFNMGDSVVTLQGDPGLKKGGISLKTMVKEMKQKVNDFW